MAVKAGDDTRIVVVDNLGGGKRIYDAPDNCGFVTAIIAGSAWVDLRENMWVGSRRLASGSPADLIEAGYQITFRVAECGLVGGEAARKKIEQEFCGK
jgi:hypothetical protein